MDSSTPNLLPIPRFVPFADTLANFSTTAIAECGPIVKMIITNGFFFLAHIFPIWVEDNITVEILVNIPVSTLTLADGTNNLIPTTLWII